MLVYTNVTDRNWTAQYKPTVTNWAGGGPNSEHMLLGANQVTPLVLKNLTFMISGRAKMKKIHWVQTFPLSVLTGMLAWWSNYNSTHLSTLNLHSKNLNQKDGVTAAKQASPLTPFVRNHFHISNLMT